MNKNFVTELSKLRTSDLLLEKAKSLDRGVKAKAVKLALAGLTGAFGAAVVADYLGGAFDPMSYAALAVCLYCAFWYWVFNSIDGKANAKAAVISELLAMRLARTGYRKVKVDKKRKSS